MTKVINRKRVCDPPKCSVLQDGLQALAYFAGPWPVASTHSSLLNSSVRALSPQVTAGDCLCGSNLRLNEFIRGPVMISVFMKDVRALALPPLHCKNMTIHMEEGPC